MQKDAAAHLALVSVAVPALVQAQPVPQPAPPLALVHPAAHLPPWLGGEIHDPQAVVLGIFPAPTDTTTTTTEKDMDVREMTSSGARPRRALCRSCFHKTLS
jgi:hypothetical protein